VKKALYIAVAGLLLMFLLINIASSQSISPLYFDLVGKDPEAALSFLQQIKLRPDFNDYKSSFSLDVQKQFILEEVRQTAEVKRLEGLLQKNASARDVLYDLSRIYNQAGNYVKAKEYLIRAKDVDPLIK